MERYYFKSYITFAIVLVITASCIFLPILDVVETGTFLRFLIFSYLIGILIPHLILSRININHKKALLIHSVMFVMIVAYVGVEYFAMGGDSVHITNNYFSRNKTTFTLKLCAACLVGIVFAVESYFKYTKQQKCKSKSVDNVG